MKVKILKSFWEGESHYVKGDIVDISNNLAHGLIESGMAMNILGFKEIIAPQKDKMVKRKRGKLKLK